MMSETTTDTLAEIEGQADYTPPEGWRVLQAGETITLGDRWIRPDDRQAFDASRIGHSVSERMCYIRRIEPQPDRIITPDDVAAEALQQQLETTEAALLEQQQRNEQLVTQGSQQRMQIAELRSEVSHVQGLLGESRKAVNSEARDKADLQNRLDVVSSEWAQQLETIRGLETQLEAVKAELIQERLERNQWQNHAQRAETQLVEKISECRNLRIELDALQQAPQAEPVAAVPTSVSDRFEEGWDAGTAQAVETIAEWLEPFRQMIEKADNLVESDRASRLCAEIMQSLPAIMRSLTKLTDED